MNAKQFTQIAADPETFLAAVPRDPVENAKFRLDLHPYLLKDTKARVQYLALCALDPVIFFDSALWFPAPRGKAGHRTVPAILYPHQEKAARTLKQAIDDGFDLAIDKSRDQGATFLLCGQTLLNWLTQEEFTVLMGSRVEDLVDKGSAIMNGRAVGNEQTLFYKLLYLLASLPPYLQPKYSKSHMFLQNLENGSAYNGQATSMGFGKGSRAAVIAVDELAAVEPKIAQAIVENIADVANCCLFNSTQGPWGESHPYAKMLLDDRVHKIILDWTDDPRKNYGLYHSPKKGEVVVYDVEYYRRSHPDLLQCPNEPCPATITIPKQFEAQTPLRFLQKDVPDGLFVFDGGVATYNYPRSAWFDADMKRPGRTIRGAAQNILRVPTGSSDLFFSFALVEQLRDQAELPHYYGDIHYEFDANGFICDAEIVYGSHHSPLQWWGALRNNRPNQGHNYVVGVDLSKGTGTSNSVAAVLDVNTNQIVGLYVTPYLSVVDFIDKVVALCDWIGGNVPPVLAWEENGAPEAYNRLTELGYYSLYVKQNKEGRTVKGANKHGWRSTSGPNGTKVEVLNYLDAALHEGLKEKPRFQPLRLYDEQTIQELGSYVWFEGKVDVGPSASQTESSGAKAAHGDRVIAVAVALDASKQQEPGDEAAGRVIHQDSWMARRRAKEAKTARQREGAKVWF